MHKKEVRVRDLYDVCDALTDLSKDICRTRNDMKGIADGAALIGIAAFIGGFCLYKGYKELERKMEKINANRVQEMQDQLDIQEEKILQLELELEDLKKG